MRIFLSYPHEDKTLAHALKQVLFKGGHNVGEVWHKQLESQIIQADAIALALTPNWLKSPYCQWEFITAVENNRKIIPVLLAVTTSLPTRLSQYQYADFTEGFDNDDKVQSFLDDVYKLAVVIDKSNIVGVKKEDYEAKIEQENIQLANTINLNGNGGLVAGGNVDQHQVAINISGTVQGGNVEIGGSQIIHGSISVTLGNLAHTINNSRIATQDDKVELTRLVNMLDELLKRIPAEQQVVAQKVADRTKELVTEVSGTEVEPDAIKMKAGLLKKAAENLKEVMPAVLSIATQIIMHIMKMSSSIS